MSFAASTAVLSDDGATVHFPGIDYELGRKKIAVVPITHQQREKDVLVVKVPGRGCWSGVGQARRWEPSTVSVYQVTSRKGRTLGVRFLCEFRADGKADR